MHGEKSNSFLACILSILLNLLLLFFVLRRRCCDDTGLLSNLLKYSCTFNIAYSAIYIFAMPMFLSRDQAILVVNKGEVWEHVASGKLPLIIFVFLLTQTICMPTLAFVYRYLAICKYQHRQVWSRKIFRPFVFLPAAISVAFTALFATAAWGTEAEINRYGPDVAAMVGDRVPFFVATFDEGIHYNLLVRVAVILLFFILVCTTLTIVFCMKMIGIYFRSTSCHLSDKTKAMQRTLCKLMMIQFFVPFLTVHVPVYSAIYCPLMDWRIDWLSQWNPVLFAWFPVIDPLVSFICVKDYRGALLICLHIRGHKTSPSSSAVRTTSAQTMKRGSSAHTVFSVNSAIPM